MEESLGYNAMWPGGCVLAQDCISGLLRQGTEFAISKNIQNFTVNGTEIPYIVKLFLGGPSTTCLVINVKFFTAKPDEMWPSFQGPLWLSRPSLPIAVDMQAGGGNGLRERVHNYINSMSQDQAYVEQAHTEQAPDAVVSLPFQVLSIAEQYLQQSEPHIDKQLSYICALHSVLMGQLWFRWETWADLARKVPALDTMLLAPSDVLYWQIRSTVNEMLVQEMQLLFENLKSCQKWTLYIAVSLVLVILIEARKGMVGGLRKHNISQIHCMFCSICETRTRRLAIMAFNPVADEVHVDSLDDADTKLLRSLRRLLKVAHEAQNSCDSLLARFLLFYVDPTFVLPCQACRLHNLPFTQLPQQTTISADWDWLTLSL